MNHAATSFDVPTVTGPHAEITAKDYKSLLDRIFARLVEMARGRAVETRTNRHYKSFIDANLTDPLVGHEISRSLR